MSHPSFTSSFASAAAGNNNETAARRDGGPVDPWSRNRVNGATQTFRRSSAANTSSQASNNPPQPSQTASPLVYIPPHLDPSRNGASGDASRRYSKERLLGIYREQENKGTLGRNIDQILQAPWHPTIATNGNSAGDPADQIPGPEVCWNHAPNEEPLGLRPMSETEREHFTTSVNSTLKMPSNLSKETSSVPQLGTRKQSFSNTSNTRTGVRRRDTSEAFSNGPLSPTEGKSFFRNEPSGTNPPASLIRRRTDLRDDENVQKPEPAKLSEDTETQSPFSSVRRAPLSAGLNPPSSPWASGPQSAGFSSMGTFGSFAVGSPIGTEPPEKRPGFGSGRGGSRFKDLMSKPSNEDIPGGAKDRAFAGLGRLPEEGGEPSRPRVGDIFITRPGRSETNPYDEAPSRSGSAALSGTQDDFHQSMEAARFAAFGAGSQSPHPKLQPDDVNSPSNTNPYQSPPGAGIYNGNGFDSNDSTSQPAVLPPFGSVRRHPVAAAEDRGPPALLTGQRNLSSFGGFGAFGGLGGSQTWGTSGLSTTTPARERGLGTTAFGDSIFNPLPEPQPSSMSPFAPATYGAPGFGGVPGRPSRLAGLFPPAMQDQMRGDSRNEGLPGPADSARAGLSGRDSLDGLNRAREEAALRGSGILNESENTRYADHPFNTQPQMPPGISLGAQYPNTSQPKPPSTGSQASGSARQTSEGSPSNQIPLAQQRQMVMPDRIKWLYQDPMGNSQGPFSGLEMHDWFKAGFFTAELQVKKVEDDEWEPLAQLVRKIGNSREPFLVPQIGILHDAPVVVSTAWQNPPPTTSTTAQPPFAGAFPSFGTTLTAEQQNALERRKQEEQYLMARQKEYLAQQQAMMRHNMGPGHPPMHPLQHHSSTHSLHSQPSFGSIGSPTAFQATPLPSGAGPSQSGANFPESSMRLPVPGSRGYAPGQEVRGTRDENLPNMMDRLNFSQRAGFGFGGPPAFGQADNDHPQRVSSMLQDRAQLHHEQQQAGPSAFLGQMGTKERFEEFNQFQHGQPDEDQLTTAERLPQPIGAPLRSGMQEAQKPAPIGPPRMISKPTPAGAETFSLTQQVQRSQQAAAVAAEAPLSQQIPPVSISPLPAPAAQRNRQHVADVLTAESRSDTQTPLETPSASIAPWADKVAEASRGPSLREIQEAEAKVAAAQEEQLAAQRRAQAEQDRFAQPAVPAPPPGLPTSSTWGSAISPATPTTSGAPAWSKPVAKSGNVATNGTTKKSLAQIQKEEESRKQKALVAAQMQAAAAMPAVVVGKRYAELASKAAPAVAAAPGAPPGQWTTVGASGKVKTPATVVATPQPGRAVSSGAALPAVKTRPSVQTRATSVYGTSDKAQEELVKWARSQLNGKINNGINLEAFITDLTQLPAEVEIVADAIYANSETIDGRRFADEFVRRKRQADKGIVEPAVNGNVTSAGMDNKTGGGGWSEVAKKGPANPVKEESNTGFKVVPAKKKGAKR